MRVEGCRVQGLGARLGEGFMIRGLGKRILVVGV